MKALVVFSVIMLFACGVANANLILGHSGCNDGFGLVAGLGKISTTNPCSVELGIGWYGPMFVTAEYGKNIFRFGTALDTLRVGISTKIAIAGGTRNLGLYVGPSFTYNSVSAAFMFGWQQVSLDIKVGVF